MPAELAALEVSVEWAELAERTAPLLVAVAAGVPPTTPVELAEPVVSAVAAGIPQTTSVELAEPAVSVAWAAPVVRAASTT